jgi:chemotaxis protein methyltransferase CheR
MIYFNKATINKVVEHFTRSLGPGGYLFLGHSETLAHIPTNFARQLHDGGYYYRKKLSLEHQTQRAPRIAPLSELPVLSGRIPAPPTSTLQHTNRESFSRYETAIAQMDRNIYAEAERLFGRVLASKTDHPTSLGDALFNMNCGNFDTALDQCNRALLANDLLPEAYFLRGLIYETLHREDDSIKEYGKAILLKMDFVMPHYRLGKLCCRIGQRKNGARHLRNCMRLLEKADPETIISFSGGITRENLLGQLHNEILSIPV